MVEWIVRRAQGDRARVGTLTGMVCILANVALCAAKGAIGVLSGSVSIVADAMNNLSDASSNIVSVLGFKLAGKPADPEHPYGHGRYEYLSGLVVAALVLLIGLELIKSSVERVIHPEPVEFSLALVAVLALSMVVKLWMAALNQKLGDRIESETLHATAQDSKNDVLATGAVLACALAFAMVLTVMPVNTYAANKKAVVVTNQKQLEKALKNGATNIVIKTNKNVKITIPASKKAAKASISVQAKNATITNKASVKSIEIKDAKAFVESGKNNDIKITDSKLSLTVSKASKGADIQVAKKDADIKVVAKGDVASVTVAKTANVALTVNKTAKVDSVNVAAKGASVDLNAKGTVSDVKVSEKAADTKLNINASGKVENVQIDAKADVAVAGSTTEAVKVTVNAKNTTIKAETPIDTTLNADTKLDLSKGAEGSTVTTAENVKADVANNTTDKVSVKDSTGKETTVDAGKTETKTDDGKKDDEKKDNQKTDDNSGTVTPAPIPLRISSVIVCSSTEVRVYFNQTVPNEIATDQVVITDEAGNAVSVESVERGDLDTQAYFVTLSSALKDRKYQVELTISSQKFVTSFLYDETVWAPLDAALKIVNEEFKKTHTVSVSGLESAEICRQAF